MLKDEVLKALKDSEAFISGQEMCERFSVSRTAIWKVVGQLKEEGYDIMSVSNKGYRLQGGCDVLSRAELVSTIDTKWLGRNLLFYDEIDSTNSELKRIYGNSPQIPDGTLAIAKNQTAGRGRRGRQWDTEPDENVAMSFLLKPEFAPEKASMLTIVAALSVARATMGYIDAPVKIKWPNDIVLSGKKYCGILTEMSSEPDYIHYVVVGIGINVNTREFPLELSDMATSLYLETGEEVSRASLINDILHSFEFYYEKFLETEDLSALVSEYNGILAGFGEVVRILDPKGEFTGISRGINENGELLVEKEDGSLEAVYAGEVSVRGLYSYV